MLEDTPAAGRDATGRYVPTAAYYSLQWYLRFIGNLERIWTEFRGGGVHIGILDEGIQSSHPALAGNYDASLEVAGFPASAAPGSHGTAVAGLIAANGDTIGVAPAAWITGVPWLSVEPLPQAFDDLGRFDIVNNSWGPRDPFGFGRTDGDDTFRDAVLTGRNGLGTIVVKSAGNSGDPTDGVQTDTNFDAVDRSRFAITVGAIGDVTVTIVNGELHYTVLTDFVSPFSTRGANRLVSAPGVRLATTDRTGPAGYSPDDYTYFYGTSGAAPIVSGVVALMLSANDRLGWRDVREILAVTADATTWNDQYSWTFNGAAGVNGGGLHYSNDVGFGQVDAFEAVRLAEVWSLFGSAKTSANEATASVSATPGARVEGSLWSYSFTLTAALRVEHAELTLAFSRLSMPLSDLWIDLVSADGTVSILSGFNTASTATAVVQPLTWTYGSEAFRGELAAGTWTVRLSSQAAAGTLSGFLETIGLDLYGSAVTTDDVYHFTDEAQFAVAAGAATTVVSDTNGGSDWIDAAALTQNLTIDLRANATSKAGSAGLFRVAPGSTIENAVTGDGNDTLSGNGAGNHLVGMRGDDLLRGLSGNDTLDGGAGTDTVDYGGDADEGGGGSVAVDLGGGTATDGFGGHDSLADIENAIGTAFADTLIERATDKSLAGGDGDGRRGGGAGNDTLDGGAGRDTAVFSGARQDYVLTFDADGWVTVRDTHALRDGVDRLRSVEALSFSDGTVATVPNVAPSGVSFVGGRVRENSAIGTWVATATGIDPGDTLTYALQNRDGSAYAGPFSIDRISGEITVATASLDYEQQPTYSLFVRVSDSEGLSCVAAYAITIVNVSFSASLQRAGRLNGTSEEDVLRGSAFSDTLVGGAGADTLIGGTGNDVYVVDDASDLVVEDPGEGNDTVRTALASYVLADGVETLIVTTSSGASDAGNGLDNLLQGAAGNDVLWGLAGNDTLRGGAGNDTLFGGAHADRLWGGSGDDLLDGGDGGDTLMGGYGNDTLLAAGRGDVLTGGEGRDVFVFSRADAVAGSGPTDVITDFQAGFDVIDLSAIRPDAALGSMEWLGNALAKGRCGAAFASGRLVVDWTGDGRADLAIRLTGVHGLNPDGIRF